MICRMRKPPEHVGRILFVNAVNEVSRKNAQSQLDETHIRRIYGACARYADEDGFSRAVSLDEIAGNNYSLNIALYVRADKIAGNDSELSAEEYCGEWLIASESLRCDYGRMNTILDGMRV